MLGPAQHVNELLTIKFLEARGPTGEHVQRLNRALALARRATADSVLYLRDPANADALYDSIRNEFFQGTRNRRHTVDILGTLALTAEGLHQQINISDVAGRGLTTEGFADGYTHFSRGVAKSIHLEFMLLGVWSEHAIARILIHEATHKFADTKDYAYMSDPDAWEVLTPSRSIKNADSYAYAALSFHARKIVNFRTFISAGGMPVPDLKALAERGARSELISASLAQAKAAR